MKHPANAAEMISAAHPNAKALHELILYYLRERSAGNLGLTRLIICNIYVVGVIRMIAMREHRMVSV
jgi:hypothetical protein